MTTIVTRASKGVPLTATDNDNNLNNLNDNKVEQTLATGSATLPSGTTAERDGSPSAGFMRFNSTDTSFEGYDGTEWGAIGGGTSGVENSVEYTATAGQTSFAAVYTVGSLSVFLNGLKLDAADYTATDGANVVLDTGATVGDSVFIQSFGTFELADHYTKVASDARYLTPTGDGSGLTGITGGGPSLGTNSIIRTNAQTISEDITIPVGTNGMSIGDITIADTYTVTVNGRWVVI